MLANQNILLNCASFRYTDPKEKQNFTSLANTSGLSAQRTGLASVAEIKSRKFWHFAMTGWRLSRQSQASRRSLCSSITSKSFSLPKNMYISKTAKQIRASTTKTFGLSSSYRNTVIMLVPVLITI